MSFNSGDFVLYRPDGTPDHVEDFIGLVLRVNTNEHADGSNTELIELIPLTKVQVPGNIVKAFNAEKEADPKEVVGATNTDVTGIGAKKVSA